MIRLTFFVAASCLLFLSCASSKQATDESFRSKAREYAQEFILIDTHVDTPYRLREKMEDISQPTAGGNFDYVRAKEGGLNAPFMSIYVPAEYEGKGGAKLLADTLIDMVEKFSTDWPDKFVMAHSTSDVKKQFTTKKISLCLGMENGSPIEHDLENLRHFYNRGIRYITLAHSKDNHISDSSYDTSRTSHGLSPFGKEVVLEMNRLGIMVDVSHITDEAFYAVMNISQAPAIASHSSCRFFTPGWERNMSDDMIRVLAMNGGVIMINFGSSFINGEYFKRDSTVRTDARKALLATGISSSDPAAHAFVDHYEKEHPIGFYADVKEVADHIDHVVKLVGVNHVGFGSDFDGVGDSLPTGLKDVSQYPNLIYELLKRNYSKEDIQKICGLNLLRVWSKVEQVASQK
ncbi:dipeptidase [bacterium]|nr:dipeptidase [bacterium]